MELYVIGDRDTVLGFQLAGAQGKIAPDAETAQTALKEAINERKIGLILITRPLANDLREMINRRKMSGRRPAVIEIPGSKVDPPKQTIDQMVSRAIGISM